MRPPPITPVQVPAFDPATANSRRAIVGNRDASRIYKTNDAGATWELQFRNDDPKAFLDAMSFWDRDLTSRAPGTDSATMRKQVERARGIQQKRFGSATTNAMMDSRLLKQHCELDDSCLLLMKQAMDEMGLSARAFDKVRRVARTIADMEGSESIREQHVAEAVQYRLLDRRF